jgi:hypothetical protein
VLKKSLALGRVLTPLGDDSDAAGDNLAGVTITVELGKTNPLTELLGVGDLDQGDLLLRLLAKSLNELDVRLLINGLRENAKESLSGRESLGSLTETTGKTVVDKSTLKSTLEGVLNGDFSGRGDFGDFDLLDNVDLFGIRLVCNVSKGNKQ